MLLLNARVSLQARLARVQDGGGRREQGDVISAEGRGDGASAGDGSTVRSTGRWGLWCCWKD